MATDTPTTDYPSTQYNPSIGGVQASSFSLAPIDPLNTSLPSAPSNPNQAPTYAPSGYAPNTPGDEYTKAYNSFLQRNPESGIIPSRVANSTPVNQQISDIWGSPEAKSVVPDRFLSANPYAPGSREWAIFNAYQTSLQRDPERTGFQGWAGSSMPLDQVLQQIAGSPEARTWGRARSEVNSQIDDQIASLQRQMGISKQDAERQLAALDPMYQSKFNDLSFNTSEQERGLDSQLMRLLQDTDISGRRLTSQVSPAILEARAAMQRRGITDLSTITADRINAGLKPIFDALADLTRSSQNKQTDIGANRFNIESKALNTRSQLVNEREGAAKAIRDKLDLLFAQLQEQGNQAEAQRSTKTSARAGELGDLVFGQDLQSKTLAETVAARQAQNAMDNQKLQETIREFNERKAAGKL